MSNAGAADPNTGTPVAKAPSPVEAALAKTRAGQVMGDEEIDVKLTGHPAAGEEDDAGAGPGAGEGEEDPDKKAKPSAGEGEGEAKAVDDKKKEPPEPKHKTVEEANKATEAAVRKMTSATEETAELRRQNAALTAQVSEAQEKISERASELTEEAMESFTEGVLEEMQELDNADPEYRKKMAKLWGKIHKEREKQFSKALKQAAKEVVDEALTAKDQKTQERNERTRVWEKANRVAVKSGLEMEDLGADEETGKPQRSDDYLLFWRTAPDAPEELDEDGKIEWTIKEVQRILGRKVKTVKEKEKAVADLQARQQPLGRGSAGPVPAGEKESAKPSTLNTALEKAKASRRI